MILARVRNGSLGWRYVDIAIHVLVVFEHGVEELVLEPEALDLGLEKA